MTTNVSDPGGQRILHVIAPAAMGGAERVAHDVALCQRARGDSVAVLALLDRSGPDPWLVTALRSQDVSLHTSRTRHHDYVSEISAIRRSIREARADVMHCHGYRADVLGLLAATRLDVAIVCTAHGFTGGSLKNRCYEWLDRCALRRFDVVIAVSSQLQATIAKSGVSQDRISHVQNAVQPLPLLDRSVARSRLGLDVSTVAIGWIGRLSWEKGPDVFLESIARLGRRDFQAVMVGDGRERERLEMSARRLKLADRIRFAGSIPNAGELLAAFDLVVLSSRTEGLPIILLEAMNAGIPLVATQVGEIPAATSGGRFAELVPPQDPAAIAKAIETTLIDRDAAVEMARRASVWVQTQFGTDRWLDQIAAVYQRAISGRVRQ